MIWVDIVAVDPAFIPKRKTAGSAGYDLVASEDALLYPMQPHKVDVGFKMALPPNTEAQIRPRSGLTLEGIWAAFGTIDSDYRGPVAVTLLNINTSSRGIRKGQRIAQLVFAATTTATFKPTTRLDETERGEKGFGSTGKEG